MFDGRLNKCKECCKNYADSNRKIDPKYYMRALSLYENWQNSGFCQRLAPSIDRIDNNRGYEFNNMQWLTMSQNAKKSNK